MKQIYEVIEECKLADSMEGVLNILNQNGSLVLQKVLYYTYHPRAKWYISEFPKDYKEPDTLPGVSISNLYTEIRRLYLFQVGHPEAAKLTEQRRNELLLQTLEGMERKEAEVFVDIMKGDLGIQGLNYEEISKVFPDLFKN
jgi:hypothetical protein